MRCLAMLVGLCLLVAGAAPARTDHKRVARSNAELAAVTPLAKLAVRRHDGARPLGTSLPVGAFVAAVARPLRDPPRIAIVVGHRTPAVRWPRMLPSFDARGPPETEAS